MANVMSVAVLILCLAIGLPAHGRDTRHLLPIAIAMEVKDAQEKLDGSVKFYFGDQLPAQVFNEFRQRCIQSQDQCVWQIRRESLQLGLPFSYGGTPNTRAATGRKRGHQHRQLLQQKSTVERDRVRMPRGGDHRWRGFEM